MTTAFQRKLNAIIRRSIATPRELSEEAGCSPQHIRAVARGDCSLSLEKAETISSYLADEADELRQLEGFLGISGATHFHPDEVENDDCLQDEIYEARNHFAAADSLLKAGERGEAATQAKKGIEKAKAALTDIEQPAQ